MKAKFDQTFTLLPSRLITGFIFLQILFWLWGCDQKSSSVSKAIESDAFRNYWYGGKAELSSYTLSQSRYGEVHDGHAVLIFVSEPFSKSKQVKLDHPEQAGKDRITVLKMNFTKKFVTGIYPYSMMLSVFTPIAENAHSLKTSATIQEWCGQVFTQMNLDGAHYNGITYSYFEAEGDHTFQLPKTLLEDELWNLIRLDPESLPIGKVGIIPGAFASRMLHGRQEVMEGAAERSVTDSVSHYAITFKDGGRQLTIDYDSSFPHQILGWTERFTDITGKLAVTSATLKKTIVTDYWTKNKNQFLYLRDSLGLPR